MNIVKEKSSIDEGYYDNRSLSDISRRNDRDESKGSSKYNEDTAHTNFYAMFNTGQFSHNVYVHIDVLESKFFILALFESKHCTRLEINCNTLKVDLSRKSYHSVNFHDQQMKHLLLKNCEITEHIEGMRKISRNERLADERALEVLNNHKDTLFTMKLLKLTNLIYSLSRLELSGAYEINKVGLTELLDEYECTRDNHTSRCNPINIYIFADKEAKITKELHKYVKEREIDTRREFKLNFPLKRFLYETYIPDEFNDMIDKSNNSGDSKFIYWEMHHETTIYCLHTLNNLFFQAPLFTTKQIIASAYQNGWLGSISPETAKLLEQNSVLFDGEVNSLQISMVENMLVLIKSKGEFEVYSVEKPSSLPDDPNFMNCNAFVLRLRTHWFALRKIYGLWFDLDSKNLLPGPRIFPGFCIVEILNSLRGLGYEIYMVVGNFPTIERDYKIQLRKKQLYFSFNELLKYHKEEELYDSADNDKYDITDLLFKEDNLDIYCDFESSCNIIIVKISENQVQITHETILTKDEIEIEYLMKTKKAVMPTVPRRFKSRKYREREAAKEADERRRIEEERLAAIEKKRIESNYFREGIKIFIKFKRY